MLENVSAALSTLSLPDALPICHGQGGLARDASIGQAQELELIAAQARGFRLLGQAESARLGGYEIELLRLPEDRKSTRLNSSHSSISYAVFCLNKKIHHRRRTN